MALKQAKFKIMKYLHLSTLLLTFYFCQGQSELTTPNSDCKFMLPWNCETCTFQWTGDCLNNLPEGTGILTVFNEGNEIMRYEGEMENGKFEGKGKYRDEVNQMKGTFINGNFAEYSNQYNVQIDTTTFNKSNEWEVKTQITKQIDNFYFIFPNEGYAYQQRDSLVNKCLKDFADNGKMINDPEYTEFTKIRFVTSKTDMLLNTNIAVSGQANHLTRSVDVVLSNEDEDEAVKITNPPIKHEIMHMVSKTAWGMPPSDLNWLNEGLATYAENNCSGYTVAEIYRYFLENKMLIPIETLCNNFYGTKEMIGYHQSGYIVEYLTEKYGMEKIETLWKSGFSEFENIFGISYAQMETELNKKIVESFPVSPDIDWVTLKEGCK